MCVCAPQSPRQTLREARLLVSVLWPSRLGPGRKILFLFCCSAQLLQLCPTLWDPMDCSPPGSSVHGISQARILEWVAISSSRGSSQPRDGTWVSCVAGGFFTTEPPRSPLFLYKERKESEVTQSCLTLWDPMEYCSLPGSSVRGILQTRILEWVAIPFSRGTSRPRDQTWVSHITDRRFTVWATREATSYRRNNIWWKHREWVLNICYAVNLRGVFKRLNVGFVHQKHKS